MSNSTSHVPGAVGFTWVPGRSGACSLCAGRVYGKLRESNRNPRCKRAPIGSPWQERHVGVQRTRLRRVTLCHNERAAGRRIDYGIYLEDIES